MRSGQVQPKKVFSGVQASAATTKISACATVGVVTTCTATAQSYTITRTVTPYLPNAAVAFGTSTAADIAIQVGWTDDRGVGHQVRVTTVRTKF